MGGVASSIRFTCLTAYVPMGVLLALQHGRGAPLATCQYLVSICATFGFLGLLVTIVLDRFMYGFVAIPVLGNFQFNVLQGEFGIRSRPACG